MLRFGVLLTLAMSALSLSIRNATSSSRPVALVYAGVTKDDRILAESVGALLESSPRNFKIIYGGKQGSTKVTAEVLKTVDAYAHPGGPSLNDAWNQVKEFAPALQEFIANGGRYLGFCLGAYLAGSSPGFNLLPDGADSDSEADQKGAQVGNDKDTIIQVDWKWSYGKNAGTTTKNRWIYFQEGSVIKGFKETKTDRILARYSTDQRVASTVSKYGDGWVGTIGPHPEADQDWFDDYKIKSPDGLQYEIGYDFIEATMRGSNC